MSEPRGDGVVLVGLSGSGKSTVGACLAERIGRPFVDLDVLIAEATGRAPAEHITHDGEERFRTVEAALVDGATRRAGAVIATGGGAVIDPLNRWRLWQHGLTVWLDAPQEVLAARVAASAEPRPLLATDDPIATLSALTTARAPFYKAADARLAADRPVEALADDIARLLSGSTPEQGRRLYDAQPERHHPVGPTLGRVVLGADLTEAHLVDALSGLTTSGASLIADPNGAAALPELSGLLPFGRRLDVQGDEEAKRLHRLESILEWLSAHGAERRDPILALGGGTLGDLAGFAAAVYLRGVPLVHLPTTWLAQADSSIGGKVGVDLARAKNAAGATWPAWAIVSDVAALRALPEARLRDGYMESIKAGLIGDPVLWQLAEAHGPAALTDEPIRYALLERAVRLKLAVVDRDPYETGERRVLNLGHTLGHALEVESAYRLPHGGAVALGLRAVAAISAGRGAEPDLAERIDHVLDAAGFPLRRSFDAAAVRRALLSDKKRAAGRQRWILPMAVGRVIEVDDVTDDELQRALGAIAAPAMAA